MKRFKLDTIAKLGVKKILLDFGNYIPDFVDFVSGLLLSRQTSQRYLLRYSHSEKLRLYTFGPKYFLFLLSVFDMKTEGGLASVSARIGMVLFIAWFVITKAAFGGGQINNEPMEFQSE